MVHIELLLEYFHTAPVCQAWRDQPELLHVLATWKNSLELSGWGLISNWTNKPRENNQRYITLEDTLSVIVSVVHELK